MEYTWRRQGSEVVDTRSALVQRFAPWNIVLVATLSSREIQATIDAEKASAWASLSSRLPYAGLVAVLAILGAILASALLMRIDAGPRLLQPRTVDQPGGNGDPTFVDQQRLGRHPAGCRQGDATGEQPDKTAAGTIDIERAHLLLFTNHEHR